MVMAVTAPRVGALFLYFLNQRLLEKKIKCVNSTRFSCFLFFLTKQIV